MISRRGWQQLLRRAAVPRRWSSSVPDRPSGAGLAQKKKPYVPQTSYQRVTYEYPPPPEQEPFKPVESSALRKHLPWLAGAAALLWAMYAYHHFISDDSGGEEQSHLDPGHFTTFKLTYKEDLTDDIAIIELSPKYETFRKCIKQKGSIWNGKKLWSVEVKQPEIQVVRRYTPLPLYFMQYKDSENQTRALLRMLADSEDEGRMVLFIKKYNDGEVSRYLHKLPIGSDVELRGPFTGYKFPYAPVDMTTPRDAMDDLPSRMLPEYPHPGNIPLPDNIAFFGAGTGIAPILQSLMSRNPPRGRVDVYYSVRSREEIPFKRFWLFLEKVGRANVHYFIDNEGSFIKSKDVPSPVPPEHVANIDPALDKEIEHEIKVRKMMEELRREREGGATTTPEEPSVPNPVVEVSTPSETAKEEVREKTPRPLPDEIGPRRKYRSVLEQVADMKEKGTYDTRGPAIAVVCGSEGYVSYMAGRRGPRNNEPIEGLLGGKGWTNENTFRMES
ncbi:cytochrome c mitochondrial import factor Cyc2p [Trichomonascus vanleenenianus]|uniref:oxidoreductase n=1 Tax=Trichomonascus vanleenenianus TaxID=2268995 RepID=UPI003ECA7FB4